jgi:hypothetical protein
MVSIQLLMNSRLYLPSGFDRKCLPVPSTRFDGYPQPSRGYLQPPCGYPQPPCWCRLLIRSERGLSSGMSDRTNRTHVEDVEDPHKVLLPSRDLLLVALREDESHHCISFPLLDDLPLHPRHGSAIQPLVSGSLAVRMTGMAHPFRSPIASRMDWLSPSNRLPFNLR